MTGVNRMQKPQEYKKEYIKLEIKNYFTDINI